MKEETQMAALRAALCASLMPDDNGAEMLKKQLATMDALFTHIAEAFADETRSELTYCQSARLDFLLKLQAGSARTARTLAAMEYMGHLQSSPKPDIPPPPLKNNEQKEDEA